MTFAPSAVGGYSAVTNVHVAIGTNPPISGGVLVQGTGIVPVPAYGTWGLALMAAALVALGLFLLRRS
jgi:hypothetical protein